MEIKADRIVLLKEILATQMNHWFLFPVYVTLMITLGDLTGSGAPRPPVWLLLGAIPFLLYLVRRYVRKFWLLALLHLAVIPLTLLLPAGHFSVTILHVVVGGAYICFSAYLWARAKNREDPRFYPLLGVGLSVAMLALQHYQGHREWDSFLIGALIVTLGIYFLLYYIEQYLHFLAANSSSAGHMPAREMFRSGMGLAVGYTALSGVVLFLVAHTDWLRGILLAIKNGIVTGLALFFSLFSGETREAVEETSADVADIAEDIVEGGVAEGPFWFWNIVEYVLEAVALVVLLVFLIRGSIWLIGWIRGRMRERQGGRELEQETVWDVREACEITRKQPGARRFPFFSGDPKLRIRQMYRKRVLASADAFVQEQGEMRPDRCTARESGRILHREQMASIYEKARYSRETCDGEDVKRMREACR